VRCDWNFAERELMTVEVGDDKVVVPPRLTRKRARDTAFRGDASTIQVLDTFYVEIAAGELRYGRVFNKVEAKSGVAVADQREIRRLTHGYDDPEPDGLFVEVD